MKFKIGDKIKMIRQVDEDGNEVTASGKFIAWINNKTELEIIECNYEENYPYLVKEIMGNREDQLKDEEIELLKITNWKKELNVTIA